METKYLYWGLLAVMFIALLIILFRPLPMLGAYCDVVCTYKTVPMDSFPDNATSKEICGEGCNIEGWNYDSYYNQYVFKCECCECVLVGGEELPDCAGHGPIDLIYAWFGWCEYK